MAVNYAFKNQSIFIIQNNITQLIIPCFQNLLSLLRVDLGKVEPNHLHLQALSCLRQLCAGLRRRLRFHQDPSFCSTKQGNILYQWYVRSADLLRFNTCKIKFHSWFLHDDSNCIYNAIYPCQLCDSFEFKEI